MIQSRPTKVSRRWLTFGLLLAAACAPSTKILKSWVDPSLPPGTLKKVLVLGVARNSTLRRSYEDAFVAALKDRGVEGVPSYEWAPDVSTIDRDAIAARVREEGVTQVLVTRVVNRQKVETYQPPTVSTVGVSPYGPGWYGGWYPYYSVGFSYVSSPGYVTVHDVVSLETNLYDSASEKLIWSGLSETWVETTPDRNIQPVIGTLIYRMRADRIF